MNSRSRLAALALVGASATGWLLPRVPIDISLPAAFGVLLAAAGIGLRRTLAPAGAFVGMIGLTLLSVTVLPYLTSVLGVPVAVRFALAAGIVVLGVVMRPPAFRLRGGNAVVIAFAAFQLVPSLLASDPLFGLLRLANWAMFVPLAFVVWRPDWLRSLTVYALGAGVVMVVGTALQAFGLLPGIWGGIAVGVNSPGLLAERSPRFTSFLQNPNDLGLAMVTMVTIALALTVRTTSRSWLRPTVVALAVAFGVVLLSTSSRGAILAVPVVLAFAALASRSVGTSAVAISVAGIAVVVSLSIFSGSNISLSSIYDLLSGHDQSALTRLMVWSQRLSATGVPVLGTGYGAFIGLPQQSFDIANRGAIYALTTVDNGWLKLVLEEGLVGAFLFATVLATALVRAWRLASSPPTRGLGIVIGGTLLAIAMRGLSADIFDINPWNMVIWLVVGLSFYSDRQELGVAQADPKQWA